jgi:hypothetical protein
MLQYNLQITFAEIEMKYYMEQNYEVINANDNRFY